MSIQGSQKKARSSIKDGPMMLNGQYSKLVPNIREFLNYAKIDYIYTREDYLRTHGRAKEIVAYMEEDASLHLLIDTGEAKLYRYIK